MLDVQFGEASDVGKIRPNNEDATGSFIPPSRHQARSHGYLFAVADGVGGLDHGEIAAATAISTVVADFARAPGGSMLISLLPRIVQQANLAVYHRMMTPRFYEKKMATTLVLCAMRYDQAVVSHIGDSRCYLVRGGKARLVTQDHTLVNEQKKMGLIAAGDTDDSQNSHVLVRSLGADVSITPDTTAFTLQTDDVIVLCTDGVHGILTDIEIAAVSSKKKSAGEIAYELVKRAVELDGSDNATAQVIRVRSVEQVGMYRGRPYRVPG